MAYTALDKARANLAKAGIKQRLAEIAAEGAADARKIAERKHAEEIAAAEDRYREAIRKAEKAALKAELDRITALDKAAKAESEVAALSPAPSIESAQDTANEQREAAKEIISQEDTAAIDKADDQEAVSETAADESAHKTSFSVLAAKKFPHLFGRKRANASIESAQDTAEEISKEDTEAIDTADDQKETPAVSEAADDTLAADTEQKKIDPYPDDMAERTERAEQIVIYKVKKAYPHTNPTNEQLIEVLGKIRQEAFSLYAEATKEETDETKKKKKEALRDAIVDICNKTVEEIKNEKEEK